MLQHLPLRDPRETLREPRDGSGSSIATRKAQETFWLLPAQPELELPIGSAGPVRAQAAAAYKLQIAVELGIGLGPVRLQIAVELAMSF